jgi:hypothetical protein
VTDYYVVFSCHDPLVQEDREQDEAEESTHALGEGLPAGETSGLVEEEAADSVTIRVMGWLLATARSKSGMLSVWTEAVLAKAGGNLWLVSRRCGYNQPRRLKAK